jgi:hypothetical protein
MKKLNNPYPSFCTVSMPVLWFYCASKNGTAQYTT